MTVLSGSLGMINGLSHVRSWSIEDTSSPVKGVSSASRGGTMTKGGVRDWSGSASLFGVAGTWMPGDIVSFVGYKGPTTGVKGTAGIRSSGSAIIESLTMNWNWETNEYLSSELSLLGNGTLAHASGVAIADNTSTSLVTPCGSNVLISDVILPDVVSAVLTISEASKSYVTSSTSCWTARKKGTGLTWTLAIVQRNDSGVAPVAIGSNSSIIKLPAGGSNVWELAYAHLDSVTGVVVSPETGDIISQTLNFSMTAISDANDVGYIKKPGSVTNWWPVP